jgi:hypothetical protein
LQVTDRPVVTAEAAVAFYSTLAAAMVLGIAIEPNRSRQGTLLDGMINGVIAVPMMTVVMLMTAQPKVMGKFTIKCLVC